MFFSILIVFFSLMGLIVLHELGHFVLAKKFGVRVEEFGVGLPPRLFGKKFGETIYSLNLLPFGAFVKLEGEEGGIESSRSFSGKPIWQRSMIILGGVVSFWLIAAVIFGFLGATAGIPSVTDDSDNQNIINPKVQIISIAKNSPAEMAGIKMGDTIASLKLKIKNRASIDGSEGEEEDEVLFAYEKLKITKVKEIQEFTEQYKGQEVILTIQRGGNVFDVSLTPRVSPPEGEGAMGVGLARIAQLNYPWYEAPVQGVIMTGRMTVNIIEGFSRIISGLIAKQGVPPGVQVSGPIGIVGEMKNALETGISYFLYFFAVISIYLAIFNILPIPALDGGKMLFLGIEALRKKPLSPKIEQKITAAFFMLLIALMVLVTIKDIAKIF